MISTFTTKHWLIILITAAASCVASLDGGIVNVALPIIGHQLGVTNIMTSQWVISAYLFVICVALPLCGKLGDIYSRRNLYLLGLGLFTISSLLCALSITFWQLIAARCLQGLGAALLFANDQAIIVACIPEEKHGRALSINTTFSALGAIAGPGLGGIILNVFSWQGIFYINVPFGLILCWFGYKFLREKVVRSGEKFDIVGAAIFAGAISLLLILLGNGNHWHWHSLSSVSCAVGLLILTGGFYIWERHVEFPVLNFNMFYSKNFLVSVTLAFLTILIIGGNTLLLPFCLYSQLHLSPILIGAYMLIPPLFIVALTPLSGYLADTKYCDLLVVGGLLCMLVGLLLQAFFNPHAGLWQIILSQSLLGIGYGLFQAPNNHNIMDALGAKYLSSGNSIVALTRNLGRIIGVVVGTLIFVLLVGQASLHGASSAEAFFAGFKGSLLVGVGLLGLGFVLATAQMVVQRARLLLPIASGEVSSVKESTVLLDLDVTFDRAINSSPKV